MRGGPGTTRALQVRAWNDDDDGGDDGAGGWSVGRRVGRRRGGEATLRRWGWVQKSNKELDRIANISSMIEPVTLSLFALTSPASASGLAALWHRRLSVLCRSEFSSDRDSDGRR